MEDQAPVETAPEAVAEPQVEAPQVEEHAQDTQEPEPKTSRKALEDAFKAVDGSEDPVVEAKTAPSEPKPEVKEGEQPRGEDGKFVAKTEDKPEVKLEGEEKPADTAKAPISEAPARFSPDAKAAWKDAPEAVRGEVNRAMQELTQGIQAKDTQLEQVKQVFDFAQSANVQPKQLIDSYLQTEQLLYNNPPEAIRQIAARFGQTPEQYVARITGGEAKSDPQGQQMVALQQEIQGLKAQLGQVSGSMEQQKQSAVMSQVEAFSAEHPRFEELSDSITHMLQTGFASTLEDAYDKAERLNPAPVVVDPAPTPAPVAQPRQARSLTGGPTNGSNPASLTPSKTTREALERAMSATAS